MSYKDNVKNAIKLDFGTESIVGVKDYTKYIQKANNYLIWQTINLDGTEEPTFWFVDNISHIFGRDKKTKVKLVNVTSNGKVLKCSETINSSITYTSFIVALGSEEFTNIYSLNKAGSIKLYEAMGNYIAMLSE